MVADAFKFEDEMSYQSPEEPDCLMVPEAQWDKLHANLKQPNPKRDHLLWAVCGLCGGGFLTCAATIPVIPEGASNFLSLTYTTLAVLLAIAALATGIAAEKLSGETTSQQVYGQMAVLRVGFRKLTSKPSGERSTSGYTGPP